MGRGQPAIGSSAAPNAATAEAALRANKSETFDCLKFTLEGAGE
jgi:hypothetical protein